MLLNFVAQRCLLIGCVFCPRIENEYILRFLRRLLPGISIGILPDDIELHRPSDREIGEVASARFAQKTR